MSATTKTILHAANLLDAEAKTWADGWAVRQADDSLVWDKEGEWAHVRWFKLDSSAAALRKLAARLEKKESNR